MVAEALDTETTFNHSVRLYLELLKRCLSRCFVESPDNELFRSGAAAHPDADSMIGWDRMDNVVSAVETVLREDVPGDLVETGVWRGGTCILMAGVLAAHGVADRSVWVADSFAGFPEIDAEKWPQDAMFQGVDLSGFVGVELAVPVEEVRRRFAGYGLLSEQVRFLEGFFADTLPTAPIDRISVLRLDGDFYQSTYQALDALYPRLSPGGFCIVDDYGVLSPCREATNDFRERHGITEPIETIDWTGVYWRKAA